MAQTQTVEVLKHKVEHAERLAAITNRIHAAKDLDVLLVDLKEDLVTLFGAEHLTLYAVDYGKRELYSRFLDLDTVKEIRVPIGEQSISGYVAQHSRLVNILDVYNAAELKAVSPTIRFDSSWDTKSGFRTKQLLTAPILHDGKVVGVMQLVNKCGGTRFAQEDEAHVLEVAKTLGIALFNQYRLAKQKPTKFDYLVTNQIITQEELATAIVEARKKQADLASLLIDQYKVPPQEVGKSLAQFYQCPFVEFDEKLIIPPELMKNISFDYLKAHYWIPLRGDHNAVEVLLDDPMDLQKVQDIQRLIRAKKITFCVGLRKDIVRFFYSASGQADPSTSGSAISSILGELVSEDAEAQKTESPGDVNEDDSAIVRLANQIITDAYKMGASDIHIEPYSDKRETMIRFRVDGICSEYQKIPPSYRRALVSRVKIMANLDIAERRKPQDGKIQFRLPNRQELELRVATVPTAGGNEDVVMRLLAASEPLPLDKLNFSERNMQAFKKILAKPYGIILVVGPTGSGKTTTLHAALGYINTPERKIWTAEDPVEITQYGLRQVQVQSKIGFTFAAAMRAFLRADPDVIMVGEMRDKETAETGIEASLTGHLVFSTLHTNSAVETVTRLLEMGMDPFNFADALLGVLAQRLVRTICKQCKEAYHPPREAYEELERDYGAEAFAKLGIQYDDAFRLSRGKGCEACKNTGYKGRMGIYELLIATDEIKRHIQNRSRMTETLNVARAEGMTTLLQDGIIKVIQGVTEYKQVKAVAMK